MTTEPIITGTAGTYAMVEQPPDPDLLCAVRLYTSCGAYMRTHYYNGHNWKDVGEMAEALLRLLNNPDPLRPTAKDKATLKKYAATLRCKAMPEQDDDEGD